MIPTTVFTPLEYGCCGLSEEDAASRLGDSNVEVYHSAMTPLEWTIGEHHPANKCYAKIIVNKADNNRVVGFHVLSPHAGEITQGWAWCVPVSHCTLLHALIYLHVFRLSALCVSVLRTNHFAQLLASTQQLRRSSPFFRSLRAVAKVPTRCVWSPGLIYVFFCQSGPPAHFDPSLLLYSRVAAEVKPSRCCCMLCGAEIFFSLHYLACGAREGCATWALDVVLVSRESFADGGNLCTEKVDFDLPLGWTRQSYCA